MEQKQVQKQVKIIRTKGWSMGVKSGVNGRGLGRTTKSVQRAGHDDPFHFLSSLNAPFGAGIKHKHKFFVPLICNRFTKTKTHPLSFLSNFHEHSSECSCFTQKPPLKPRFQRLHRRRPTIQNPKKSPIFQIWSPSPPHLEYQPSFSKIETVKPRSKTLGFDWNPFEKLPLSLQKPLISSMFVPIFRPSPSETLNPKNSLKIPKIRPSSKKFPFCLSVFSFCFWFCGWRGNDCGESRPLWCLCVLVYWFVWGSAVSSLVRWKGFFSLSV